MGFFKQHKTPVLFFVLTLVISLLFKRSFPLIIYTICLMVAYFPLKGLLASSVTSRAIVALVMLLCLFQMEAMAFWILHVWVSPLTYILVSFATILVGLWLIGRREGVNKQTLRLTRLDLLLILPSLLIGGMYVAGTLAPAEKNDVTIVRSITYGMDDATHAIIFSDALRHGSNILAGNERSKLMIASSHASYPMGWHISTSIIAESFAGNKNRTPIESIEVYFYAKVLTFMLTVAAITILVYSFTRRLWPKLNPFIEVVATSGISIFVSSLLVLPLFFDGFFSFMPVILYTALFAIVSMDNKDRVADATFLTLLTAASSLTWMLTGPILIVALVVYYLSAYSSIKKIPPRAYWTIATGGVFMLAQAYVLYSANKNSLLNISNKGGITNPEHLLLALSLAVFFFLWLKKGELQNTVAKPLFGLVVAFVTALSLLLMYLTTQTSEITYYFYKIQVPLLVLLVPLACTYLFGVLLDTGQSRKFTHQTILVAAGFSILGISIPSIVGYSYIFNTVSRAHSYVISSSDATILIDKALASPVSSTEDRTYFAFPSDAPRTILTSNISRMGYKSTRCDYELFAAIYNYDIKSLDKSLNHCAAKLPAVRIYTDEEGKKQILQQLSPSLIREHEVELVVI